MADRKPLSMKPVKIVYNLAQILFCAATFLALLPIFTSAPYGIGTEPQSQIEFWVFVYFCCKFLDFGDTVFMVLEKKDRQITFLHLWHHGSIVPLFAYFLSRGIGGGVVAVLPLLNSLVHVVMYSHYLFMSLVPNCKPWWKPLITGFQMGHHVLCLIYMSLNWYYGKVDVRVAVGGTLWGLSILLLFGNFFLQQYMKNRASSRKVE